MRLFLLLPLLATLSLALPAWAKDPELSTQVSRREVGLGDSVVVKLTVLVESGESPRDPLLPAPKNASVRGPSIQTRTQVSITGRGLQEQRAITASWVVTPSRLGRLDIGPPSIIVGTRRYRGDVVSVEVKEPHAVPRSRARSSPFPFDPFGPGGFLGFPFDHPENDLFDPFPPAPPEYQLERAPDPIAFVHASVVPRRAVVGEQITLRLIAYGSRGSFDEGTTTEPTTPDFLSYSMLDRTGTEQVYRVEIDGTTYHAKKVRELALFPIRAGTLEIGSLKMGFGGPRYATRRPGSGILRQSPKLSVIVTEPPRQGRPAGYRIGDVGRFRLSASVEPATVLAGESVAVVARLEGRGNFPLELRVPEATGIVWNEPTLHDEIGARNSVIHGERTFSYVVRLDQPGRVELGEISLPYYDPDRQTYQVASADLGVVQVRENPGAKVEPSAETADPLSAVLAVRRSLGPFERKGRPWSDSPWYWATILFAPLGVLALRAGTGLFRYTRERWKKRRGSLHAQTLEALGEARELSQKSDTAAAASACERAVVSALETATGLKVRAVLKSELESRLRELGIEESLARDARQALDDCDNARFTGDLSGSAEELVNRTRRVVLPLLELGKRRPKTAA